MRSARAPARAEVVHPDTSANRLTKGRTPDVAASASVIDTVVNLCKRRGLVYQCGEIYGCLLYTSPSP